MKPLVSVIIPTFQGVELLLKVSLPSVLNQTCRRLEIIVVNDGADAQMEAAVACAQRATDIPIKYFEAHRAAYSDQKSQWAVGGAASRNLALDQICGDYVMPLDQDDMIGPGMIASRLHFFKNNPEAQLTYSKCAVVYQNEYHGELGQKLCQNKINGYIQTVTGANYIPHLTVMYRSGLKHYRYPTQGQKAADYMMWKQMITDGIRMDFIDQVQAIYNGKNNGFDFLADQYNKMFHPYELVEIKQSE